MANHESDAFLKHVCQILEAAPAQAQPDCELLHAFAVQSDADAFAALLRRHGPLVLGVCRRVLHDQHDAEDAFQARFLVLARRAASIRHRQAIGSWLYGVAYQLAMRAKLQALRRRQRERRAATRPTDPSAATAWDDLRSLLDEELDRLPEKYRAPLILCYLDGKTQDEAARALDWSLGTFRRRLDRGRELLRGRLASRGMALSAALFPAVLAQQAVGGTLPAELFHAALQLVLGDGTTAGAAAPQIILLAEAMMRNTFLTRLRWLAAVLLLVGVAAWGGRWMAPATTPGDVPRSEEPGDVFVAQAPQPANPPAPQPAVFPRRLLAVIPANYAFATPIHYGGTGARSLNTIVPQFGQLLRVPADQVTILSDKAPDPKPPIRAVIERNVQNFLASCRPQDRIVLMFVGHGVEVKDKPYLMPLEGEANQVESLIPLDWFYQQLAKCPARQKVFVVDVCRFDPLRGEERGAVAPMSAKFDALLKEPPAGVQVFTACTAGQHSLETETVPDNGANGGIMLAQVAAIVEKGGLKGVDQRPEDSIPIEALAATLGARTKAFARFLLRSEQTPCLSGAEANSTLAYDPKLPAAPRFEIQLTGAFGEGVATQAQVEVLFKDIAGLPPARPTDAANVIGFDNLPPFPADRIAAYQDDDGVSPLRTKVREAIRTIKENHQTLQDTFVRNFDPNNAVQSGQFRAALQRIEGNVGKVRTALAAVLDDLDSLEADRAKENRRWQANYDAVRGRLAARVAYLHEYTSLVAAMREAFPPMDPEIHKGWQMAARQKRSSTDAERYARRARAALEQLARDHRGTPWEVFARREQVVALGLEWQPSPK